MMRCRPVSFVLWLAVGVCALLVPGVHADPGVAVTYSPHGAMFQNHMNMGPTGATAWMRGYHFQVMGIAEQAPAHGRLQLGDLVIGANGVLFGAENGHRKLLGDAIGDAEATGEPLALLVVRGDEQMAIDIPLPKLGAFAPGWPDGCEKSAKILHAASRAIQYAQQPNGRIVTSGNMGTAWGGLLLLASGDPVYLDAARRAAYQVASIDYAGMDLNNWSMGYAGVLLAEYYLATGDDSVLESLAAIADELARGQMKSGSWGHKSPGEGYGNLNQPAVVCAIALVLARECGVGVDAVALDKALAFFGRFAQTGSIPYGDHMPGEDLDNNGTSASAAVLMHLAGREADAAAFARSVGLSYWMREHGHTGGFWSMAWGPLAAALAGPDVRTFMAEQAWYYNLARTWQGGFVHLPYQESLTRFDSSGYIESGPDFTTGGLALGFALPHQRLRILGGRPGVFGAQIELGDVLRSLRAQFLARDWEGVDAGLALVDRAALASETDRQAYDQLVQTRAYVSGALERTLLEIDSHLENRHGFLASQQLATLQRAMGASADARFGELEERFADGGVAWNVREGIRFWDTWEPLKAVSTMTWTAQGQWARALLEAMPHMRPPVWEPLAPTMKQGPQSWRSFLPGEGQALPEGWALPGFDDRDWHAGAGIPLAADLDPTDLPGSVAARRIFTVDAVDGAAIRIQLRTVRPALTRLYLNGHLIVDAVRGQRGGYAAIELDDEVFALLQPGENLLAVESTAQGDGNNRLDVGLEVVRHMPQRDHLRIERAATASPVVYEHLDDTLRVREASDQARAAFQARYDQQPVAALVSTLYEPVAYLRGVAENALADKGIDGLRAVLALATDPDWRVRSSVCNVIMKVGHHYRLAPEGGEALGRLLEEQVALLRQMLEDEHYWVRVRALIAIRTFDEQAADALPVLVRLVDDEDDWVRLNAIRSIRRISKDPVVNVRAALAALEHAYSGYSAPRAAFDALSQYVDAAEIDPEAKRSALLYLLQNPPEGDGRFLLNQVMDKVAELDPAGVQLIPVLIEAAADATHLSRIRQNPRGHAIGVLGAYGDKAAAAVPVLEGILASEDDRKLHADARQALDRILGGERKSVQ